MKTRASRIGSLLTFALSLLLLALPLAARAQSHPDFSGQWKQDNDSCVPQRTGDVKLSIQHRDPQLTVETTILHGSQSPRHALQKYTTDGKLSVSTGADGDEFRTAATWNGSALVFTVEEHEDGRILLSKETWTLTDDGATLEKLRETANGPKQLLVFHKQPATSN